MSAHRSRVALLLLFLSAPGLALARPQDEGQQSIPANIDAGVLTGDMTALIRLSETFRLQCERIAAETRVRVTLAVASSLDSGRAQTVIRRYGTGVLEADVWLLFGENYRELLAHEFEHILEQIDGVDLRQEAARGRAWILPGGAFETRRAQATGVQVLRESEPAPHAFAAPAPR